MAENDDIEDGISRRIGIGVQKPNAMLISPIIRCIVQHLNVQDLKSCRLVSREWNSVARLLLRIRSKVSLCKREDNKKFDRSPCRYFAELSETLPSFPFFNFRIYSCFHSWRNEELREFFEREEKNVRELSIFGVFLVGDESDELQSRDISAMISGCAFTSPSARFPTKLSIDSVNVVIQIPVLAHVKHLDLQFCKVAIKDGTKMRPESLSLTNVSFLHHSGTPLTSILLNDIVDFSRLKNLILFCDYLEDDEPETQISLDCSAKPDLFLDQLLLSKVTVMNWTRCRWTVQKLDLFKIPFVMRTEMEVHELIFRCADIDFAVMPPSLQKLSIVAVDEEVAVVCSSPVCLPILRSLYLTDYQVCLPLVSQLVTAPNLVALRLGAYFKRLLINLAHIPPTVKKLQLCGFKAENPADFENLDFEELLNDDE